MNEAGERHSLEQIAEDFAERYRRGERPALSEYVERYPEHESEIRDLFPALVMMEDVAPHSDESLQPVDVSNTLPHKLPQQIGDYRIIREVGRGGMGIVYEAEQISLRRHVALKVLPQPMLRDERHLRRFEWEARSAAKLHHTNVVPVFGVGEENSVHYLVMQFITGRGLDEVIHELRRIEENNASSLPATPGTPHRADSEFVDAAEVAQSLISGEFHQTTLIDNHHQGRDPAESGVAASDDSVVPCDISTSKGESNEKRSISSSSLHLPGQKEGSISDANRRQRTYAISVARVGRQVADALEHAHEQGILHRDIKPANLLLDLRGTVWVTDFGLAKAVDQQNITQTGDVLGTLRYMPPEAFGGQFDARGDIYALGLTLYEMLALRPAFEASDRRQLIKLVTSSEIAQLKSRNPNVPDDLATIVHKAVERDPKHRYQTAGEFAEDLARFIEDEPIRARKVSLMERLGRWSRRNRSLAALLGVVVLLLVVIALGSLVAAAYFNRQSEEQRELARRNGELAHEKDEVLQAEILQRKETERQTQAALLAQYESYVRQAELSRRSGRPGQRIEALRNLKEAARLLHELDLGEHEQLRLRNETIACLLLPDVQTEQRWPKITNTPRPTFDTDADAVWYADERETGFRKGVVELRRYDDNSLVSTIIPHSGDAFVRQTVLGSKGRRLVLHVRTSNNRDDFVEVWDLKREQVVRSAKVFRSRTFGRLFDLNQEENLIAILRDAGSIELWNAPTFQTVKSIPVEKGVYLLRFDPKGRRLAVGRKDRVEVLDVVDSVKLQTLRTHDSNVIGFNPAAVAWSPDGRQIAVGRRMDGQIQVWNVDDGKISHTLNQSAGAARLDWHPDGRFLIAEGEDHETRLWDVPGHRVVLRIDCPFPRFTRNGRKMAGRIRRFQFVVGEEHSIHPNLLLRSVHSASRLMLGRKGEWRLQDLLTGQRVASLGLHNGVPAFSPSGKELFVTTDNGLYRLPVVRTVTPAEIHFRIGPPKRLCDAANAQLAVSQDGSRIAYAAVHGRNEAAVIDVEPTARRMLTPRHRWAEFVTLSGNGTLVATGTGVGNDVIVWNADTGERVRKIFSGPANVALNREGNLLGIHEGFQFTLRDTHAGEVLFTSRNSTKRSPGGIAFSDDGRLFVMTHAASSIELRDLKSFAQLGRFQYPGSVVLDQVTLSPDATRLLARIAKPPRDTMLHVWNLQLIRQRLRKLNIDWDHPKFSDDESSSVKPLRVSLDLDSLKAEP